MAEPATWRKELAFALPLTALILGWNFYWFAVADRYFVFLYYHDMGPAVPETAPFSPETASRYWMTGLVAGGAAMLLYTVSNWLLGRLSPAYRAPSWPRVWAWCAGPLLVGLPLITMTANQPTLPLRHAAQVTLATLAALALALLPGRPAVERPAELAWLAADGWGFSLILIAATALDDLPRWLSAGGSWQVWLVTALPIAGTGWLALLTALRIWRQVPSPGVVDRFTAGLCLTYLLLPLIHHLLATDGYYYISSASNFFLDSPVLQLLVWLVVFGLAAALNKRSVG